jgi:hypothetical protein
MQPLVISQLRWAIKINLLKNLPKLPEDQQSQRCAITILSTAFLPVSVKMISLPGRTLEVPVRIAHRMLVVHPITIHIVPQEALLKPAAKHPISRPTGMNQRATPTVQLIERMMIIGLLRLPTISLTANLNPPLEMNDSTSTPISLCQHHLLSLITRPPQPRSLPMLARLAMAPLDLQPP